MRCRTLRAADIGASSGLFTYLFAQEVGPGGKVYAVDINQVMLDNIVRRSRELGYKHVEGRLGSAKGVPVPPGSLDVAFTSDVYHHFEFPQVMLRSIRDALKPGGAFIVIDFERIPGVSSPRTLEHVRAGKEVVIKEVEAEGFRFVEERKLRNALFSPVWGEMDLKTLAEWMLADRVTARLQTQLHKHIWGAEARGV